MDPAALRMALKDMGYSDKLVDMALQRESTLESSVETSQGVH